MHTWATGTRDLVSSIGLREACDGLLVRGGRNGPGATDRLAGAVSALPLITVSAEGLPKPTPQLDQENYKQWPQRRFHADPFC